jgi:Na+-transporting NADH:ubiquinone oxidoreductase subunit NqrB
MRVTKVWSLEMIVKVLTANRLIDGQAVWLGADGSWQETIDGALVARHPEAVEALEDAASLRRKPIWVVD